MIDLIPKGKDNAILLADLASITGRPPRVVQAKIQKLRDSGCHILSAATGGYYVPTDDAEGVSDTENYIKMMRLQALGRLRRIGTAKRWLAEHNQTSYEEETHA